MPHSAQYPNGSVFDAVDVYQDGAFMVRNSKGWLACPTNADAELKQFPDKHYKIYAARPGHKRDQSCIPINIIAKPYMGELPATWDYRG